MPTTVIDNTGLACPVRLRRASTSDRREDAEVTGIAGVPWIVDTDVFGKGRRA
ncbi:MAG TPA: hypothetical protein VH969_25345 [Actinophytocola sp.]|uniref:hypothetical protein n=1 Tax=Actinophytocola sp. TaxID=1872138 RepID=UPI002F9258D2